MGCCRLPRTFALATERVHLLLPKTIRSPAHEICLGKHLFRLLMKAGMNSGTIGNSEISVFSSGCPLSCNNFSTKDAYRMRSNALVLRFLIHLFAI